VAEEEEDPGEALLLAIREAREAEKLVRTFRLIFYDWGFSSFFVLSSLSLRCSMGAAAKSNPTRLMMFADH
jgi:hypothetical protein